jgi:hypothetical protein
MADDHEPRWLTYREAARILGMSPESLRARARREHWRKTLGNDGKARVLVPPDTACIPAGEQGDEAPAPRPAKRPEPDREGLLIRVAELEARLATAAELERARGETERERVERLEERARAERLAGEVAEIARKLAELTAAAQVRRPASLPPPSESVRRSWWPWRRAG